MADINNQGVHASNTMVIVIRGQEVGRANGVDLGVDFGTTEVPEGIGSILPAEHVALNLRSDVSIDSFFIRNRGTSGVKDVLGVPVNETILRTTPFNLEVRDKVTNQTVVVAENCTWSNVRFNIRHGAITGKNASALAIRIRQAADYEPPL